MDSGLKRKASSHGQRNKARDGMLTRDEVPAKLKRVVLQKEQNTAGSHIEHVDPGVGAFCWLDRQYTLMAKFKGIILHSSWTAQNDDTMHATPMRSLQIREDEPGTTLSFMKLVAGECRGKLCNDPRPGWWFAVHNPTPTKLQAKFCFVCRAFQPPKLFAAESKRAFTEEYFDSTVKPILKEFARLHPEADIPQIRRQIIQRSRDQLSQNTLATEQHMQALSTPGIRSDHMRSSTYSLELDDADVIPARETGSMTQDSIVDSPSLSDPELYSPSVSSADSSRADPSYAPVVSSSRNVDHPSAQMDRDNSDMSPARDIQMYRSQSANLTRTSPDIFTTVASYVPPTAVMANGAAPKMPEIAMADTVPFASASESTSNHAAFHPPREREVLRPSASFRIPSSGKESTPVNPPVADGARAYKTQPDRQNVVASPHKSVPVTMSGTDATPQPSATPHSPAAPVFHNTPRNGQAPPQVIKPRNDTSNSGAPTTTDAADQGVSASRDKSVYPNVFPAHGALDSQVNPSYTPVSEGAPTAQADSAFQMASNDQTAPSAQNENFGQSASTSRDASMHSKKEFPTKPPNVQIAPAPQNAPQIQGRYQTQSLPTPPFQTFACGPPGSLQPSASHPSQPTVTPIPSPATHMPQPSIEEELRARHACLARIHVMWGMLVSEIATDPYRMILLEMPVEQYDRGTRRIMLFYEEMKRLHDQIRALKARHIQP